MWSLYLSVSLLLISINGFVTVNVESSKEKTTFKTSKPRLRKCCDLESYLDQTPTCLTGLPFNYSDIPIYDDKFNVINGTIPAVFDLIPGKFSENDFGLSSYCAQDAEFVPYLMKNGHLKLDLPNAYLRWQDLTEKYFCMDYRLKIDSNTTIEPVFYVTFEDMSVQYSMENSHLYITVALFISSFFLVLVFLVYSLLKELRNLGGKILMAYVASLFMAFFLLAIIRLDGHEVRSCQCLTYGIYFGFLATFCWMSVMSYDIWWTFRGYAKARQIHRRGENFKFIIYCVYAWGLPFCMTVAFAILNETDLRQYPWLITPKIPVKGCFLEGGEKLLYLYTPMLILIICNWMFYLMTAYNLWRLSRGTAVLDSAAAGTPSAHRSQRNRFMVYVKLSIVMGLNWLLEVVSFQYAGFRVWYLSDAYNVCIGFAIFLIFCCKPKIYRKLAKLYIRKKAWSPSNHSSTMNSTSGASQETSLPLVCNNPKGPAFQMKPY